MQDRIPVPTDNVYKFYALFSLLALIFCIGAVIYVGRSTNELLFDSFVELESLKQEVLPTPAQEMKRAALERKVEIAMSDRKVYNSALGGLIAFSGFGIFYGFRKWQTEVQPVLDETARTQLEIAKLQLEKLRTESQAAVNHTGFGGG